MDTALAVTEEEELILNHPDSDFFCDFGVAHTYVMSASDAHSKQWELAGAIEEHIEGKKPMEQKRLDDLGMSWAYNYNYYRARGKIEGACGEFVDKMVRSLALGYPEFRNTKDEDTESESPLKFLADYNERGIVSAAIGCAFSEMMEEEGEVQTFLNQTEYISYTFGYCGISWPIHDWKGDPIHIKHLATRPGSTITKLDEWVIFKTENNNWLWQRYNEINDSEEKDEFGYVHGWNKEGLQIVLLKLFKGKIEAGGTSRSPDTWDEILPLYSQNASNVISNTSDIRLAKIYYKEVDGSFTECYIPWGYEWTKTTAGTNAGKADQVPQILYKVKHDVRPKELMGFVRDSGFTVSGEICKMRGAGRLIVEDSQRYNRTRNSMNNKALFAGSPWFETGGTQGNEKFKVTFSQGFVMMPPGGVIAERQPQFNISENIGLLQFEEREFSDNSQHFNSKASAGLSSRPTSDEIQLAQHEAGRARTAKDTVKVSDYSKIFLQFIRKMAKKPNKKDDNYDGHRKFFDLLLRYVPQYLKDDESIVKALKAIDTYKISLILGDIQAIQVAIGMAETPFGRNRYRRMLLIAMGHSRSEVDLLVPMYQDKYRYMQDDRITAIENDMFWNTNEVVFQLTDDHVTHFTGHQIKFDKTVQAAREQRIDIVMAWKYLVNLFVHMQMHVDPLLQDASLKDKGEEFMNQLKQDNQVLKQVEFMAQKELKNRADQAAAQPAISPKDAAEMHRENVKTESNIARQDYKAEQRVRQQDEKQQNDQELKERKLEADIALKTVETLSDTRTP
jgi:hypothetical protein